MLVTVAAMPDGGEQRPGGVELACSGPYLRASRDSLGPVAWMMPTAL